MEVEIILDKLKSKLNDRRLAHSINVMDMSVKLAKHYGVDIKKAQLAGLLHDCGRSYHGDESKEYVRKIGYDPDEVETAQPVLLHGVIGEHLARTVYELEDHEVLGAIRWHTTGKANMTLLEKVVYVADYIEPLRCFDGVEDLRSTAFENMDRCVVLCSDSTIRYILKNNLLLHKKTVETRNFSLMLLGEPQKL